MTLKEKTVVFTFLALLVMCTSILIFQGYRKNNERLLTMVLVLDEIRLLSSQIDQETHHDHPDNDLIRKDIDEVKPLSRRFLEVLSSRTKPAPLVNLEIAFVRMDRIMDRTLPGRTLAPPLLQQINNEIIRAGEAIQTLSVLSHQKIKMLQTRTESLITILYVVLVLYVLNILYFLSRIVIKPVSTLSRQIREVREGKREQIEPPGTGDEIGALGEFTARLIKELGQKNVKLEGEIAERKEIEAQCRRSASTLQNVLDNSNPICITNLDYELLEANKAYQKIFSLTGMGARPIKCYESRPGSLCQTGMCPLQQIVNGKETVQVEARKSEQDGKESDFIITARAFRDENGTLIGIVESFQDITEIKQAEAALAAERERLAVTLRSIGDGVVTTDTAGRIVLINAIAEELTGWKQEEIVGRPFSEVFLLLDGQTRLPCSNPVEKVLRSGRFTGLDKDMTLVDRNGQEHILADSGAPITDKQGNTVGVVLVFRDVTEEARMEEELLKIKKLESLGVLAGGIAHDFNNILSAIMGNLSMAALLLEPETKAVGLLHEAEKASVRAQGLTQQLLTFSKGGAPVKKRSSIEEVIRDSADFVLRGSNSRCTYSFPADLWPVEIDPGQISQVVQNIILNASRAMPEGGTVEVTCKNFDNSDGTIVAIEADRLIRIAIRDEGIGISSELMEKIFDPYFSTSAEGSGLGLAICHSIISQHGGWLTAHSEPGAGSTFLMYLPAMKTASPEIREETVSAEAARGSGRIMIMDDEETIRDIAQQILEHYGFEVIQTADGQEAVTLYEEMNGAETIALIIMDLTIPGGMGGKEAAEKILAMNPEARIIVSSGYSTDPIMASYAKYGFRAAVHKPYRAQQLVETVNQVLAGREIAPPP